MKIIKKNFFWILTYGLFIIIGAQILATYLYKEINDKTQNFIADGISSEKIIDFETLPYTPGKGNYTEMILTNKKHYPIFVQEDYEKGIKINSEISKQPNSMKFEILNSDGKSEYTIHTAKAQQNFMRFLFLLGTLAISVSTLYKYGIERK